ncbi:MAG TPA: hypothetical protein VHG33_02790 [Woeseiaceae bacterium]|nr:hypothetical protein [Woeseiaceae bacterium]
MSRHTLLLSILALTAAAACSDGESLLSGVLPPEEQFDPQATFRFDTFGDEALWTDVLRMHEVVMTISPETALAVGLKVDAEALPEGLLETADLTDPATTVELLRLNAVVGVQAEVSPDGAVTSFGITCALCHSDVDDSVAPGIGVRLDGWPAKDLDPGLILSLSPFFDDKPVDRQVLQSWGPGKYDPYWNLDGINDPVVIAPVYGLKDVPLETYTGEGPISYWNSYVAVTQMGGQGNFSEPELNIEILHDPDLVTPKLPALLAYQESLEAPPPPAGSFEPEAAERGRALFEGKAQCSTCHTGPTFTDSATTLHEAHEVGADPLYATRTVTKRYRTTPLRALWQHPPYYHNGEFATLADVIDHYDLVLNLGLPDSEKADLHEYLKSL